MADWVVHTGDCLDLLRSVPDETFDAVITDPPYGIAYKSARFAVLEEDEQPFVWFLPLAHRVLKEGGALVCFCRWDTAEAFRLSIEWAGFQIVSQVIWDRMVHGMGDTKGAPAPRHDTAWIASKGRFEFHGRRPPSVLRHRRPLEVEHPTEKPVELMAEIAADYCPPGGVILDPCCGSGATGCGAIRERRGFVGIEIDPTYADLARRRIAAEGQAPMLL